jgi:DNA invertase Pin-like site-specific DNA recombinase
MLQMIGVFAQFGRGLLKERIRAGLVNARAKGKRLGRRPIFDIEHFGTVARLRGQGKSIREIAKELRVSKSLVHKTLKNISPPALDFHGSED